MASFADISIRFSANLKQFSTQTQNATRDLKRIGKQMQNTGAALSVGLTAPIVAFGVKSVFAFDQQSKALAQVEAGLKSTGNAAGRTFDQLQKGAADLQKTSLFGDEEILKDVTAQLITFTNIAGTQFDRTQQAALDLSARLGVDLKSSAIQLGKALNDPIANLSALSRSGIQFTEDQKKVIKSLTETGKIAEAQTVILDELEKQYGGSAAAAAKAGLGPFKQLGNSIGDLSEDFGKMIVEGLTPFIEKTKALIERLQGLDDGTKKTIAVVAGLAAVVGPLLITLGYLTTNVLPGLIVAYKALATTLTTTVIPAIKSFNIATLANPLTAVLATVGALIYGFTVLIQKITPAVSKLQTLWNLVKSGGVYTKFVTLQTLDAAQAIVDEADAAKKAAAALADYNAEIAKMGGLLGSQTSNSGSVTGVSIPVNFLIDDEDIRNLTYEANEKLQDSTSVEFPDPSEALRRRQTKIDEFLQKQADKYKAHLDRIKEVSEAVGNAVGNAFENFTGRLVDSLNLANSGFEGFIKGLVGTITKLIAMMLASSISQSISGATASGTATGPAAVFTTPAFIATAVGGVLAAFASIPKFADGGIVYGPTMGLMGEYSGARNNPEIIAPLDKLQSMLGGGVIELGLGTRIKGSDLEIVIERAIKKLDRAR